MHRSPLSPPTTALSARSLGRACAAVWTRSAWLTVGVTALCVGIASCDGGGVTPGGEGRPSMPLLGPADRPEQDEPLADFESGELTFEFAAGHGYWASGADSLSEGLGVEAEGAAGTERSLLLAGSTGSVIAHLSAPGGAQVRHDLSSCAGLRFWAKSSDGGSLTVTVTSDGGSAEASVDLEDSFTEVVLEWGDFVDVSGGSTGMGGASPMSDGEAGAGGASPGAFSARAVRSLAFHSAEDLWLDEVALTSCQLPQLNPPPSQPPTLGSASPADTPVARHGQLRVEGNTLVDQSGAPVQLKGVSSMWTNWDSSGFAHNKAALEFMRNAWELSVFRVAMGVEETGAYLANPLSQRRTVERAIANALELGLYIIVDWHAHEAQTEPDAARGFFDELAAEYGSHPNIIWETFNEPLKVGWSDTLKPYHTSLIETIRRRDPDNLILLGTPQWSQLVDEAAADPIGARNVMYVLHFYACTHDSWLRDISDRALGAGIGLFVSEFGGTHADGGTDGVVCEGETQRWFDWLDANNVSGVAWKLDNCGRDSSCLLTPDAPRNGPWTEEHLAGHAPLVVEWLRR